MSRRLPAVLALAVSALAILPAQAQEETKSLYDRLGGLKNIAPVVDNFVNRLIRNASLGERLAHMSCGQYLPPSYLKFQFTELLCEMSGGPCFYSGPPTKSADQAVKIAAADWEVMTGELKRSMNKYDIPAIEQEEVIELFNDTRDDIAQNLYVDDEDRDVDEEDDDDD